MTVTCPLCARAHDGTANPAQSPYCSKACWFHAGRLPSQTASPLCHDGVTMNCPICQRSFTPTGRQKYCSEACRAAAYRRRRDSGQPAVSVPKAQPRRPLTVYECDSCGVRTVGEQYCEACRTFTRRVGLGGSCPSCDEPVAVAELLGEEVIVSR